nr:monocopper oxidase-like protein SKU5 isoform X2 [Tanacetum cinerariifolium]
MSKTILTSPCFSLGTGSNIERTHGKMVYSALIVPFQLVGIGHIRFRLRIRLEVFSTSLPQISNGLQSPIVSVMSPSGVPNGTGIMSLLLTRIPPNPPAARWKFVEGK